LVSKQYAVEEQQEVDQRTVKTAWIEWIAFFSPFFICFGAVISVVGIAV